jgi:hypothetical protein
MSLIEVKVPDIGDFKDVPVIFAGKADLECDMLVLGGGPGGYSAAFRAPTWA